MRGRPQGEPRTVFERRLRELMAAAGISTYAELARRSSLTTTTIQHICVAKRAPSIDTLKGLAAALGCKVDDLL